MDLDLVLDIDDGSISLGDLDLGDLDQLEGLLDTITSIGSKAVSAVSSINFDKVAGYATKGFSVAQHIDNLRKQRKANKRTNAPAIVSVPQQPSIVPPVYQQPPVVVPQQVTQTRTSAILPNLGMDNQTLLLLAAVVAFVIYTRGKKS